MFVQKGCWRVESQGQADSSQQQQQGAHNTTSTTERRRRADPGPGQSLVASDYDVDIDRDHGGVWVLWGESSGQEICG